MNAPHNARRKQQKQGFALLLSLIALTILAVLVADLHETTGSSFAAAMAERDQLRAEYLAKSGVNLTRMLLGQERQLRLMITPFFKLISKGRPAPQLPVWHFANMILKPFADFNGSKEDVESAGYDLDMSEGLGGTGGTFEIRATAENGKINVNDPRLRDVEMSRIAVASLLYQFIAPAKYDPLFSQLDDKGRSNTRLDLVANVIDWWDVDEQRTNYDPTLGVIQSSGAEDVEFYRNQPEPYYIKGAPYDTLEELRLVRGVDDDIWATFVEPDVEDPTSRQVTVWGGLSSAINPNEAEPGVLLARVCAYPEFRTQVLCSDPTGVEPGKFIQVIRLVRMFKIPAFSRRADFVDFLFGKPVGIMASLSGALSGGMGAMFGIGGSSGSASGSSGSGNNTQGSLFTPLFLPDTPDSKKVRDELTRTFSTTSKFFTIESIGRVGNSQRLIRTVINVDDKWVAPKPNVAAAPPLGVYSYYRVE